MLQDRYCIPVPPTNPSGPVAPTGPCKPVAPGFPTMPVAPVLPWIPVAPTVTTNLSCLSLKSKQAISPV